MTEAPPVASRPVTTTKAPSAAIATAIAAPMPLVEPVTNAVVSGSLSGTSRSPHVEVRSVQN
jgi:hypothetical protein